MSKCCRLGDATKTSASARVVNDQESLHRTPSADETGTKVVSDRNGGDALILVRQNARCYIDSRLEPDVEPETAATTNDVIIIQDECLGSLPLSEIIARTAQRIPTPPTENHLQATQLPLTGLYVVDCRLDIDDDDVISGNASAPGGGLFESLVHLRTLVLSNTRLRQLPRGVATCMTGLEVLKVDGNRFEDLPADLDRLTRLTTLCLDRQRPRMRFVPTVVGRLVQLQVSDDR